MEDAGGILIMKKRRNVLQAMAVMALVLAVSAFPVHAEEKWDQLKGESTINSQVYQYDGTQNGTRLWTTIQTNYHAGGITGLVVRTPYKDIETMMGITQDEAYYGDRPILYVAQAASNQQQIQQMKDYAATLGGTALYDYQIRLFRWWYGKSWNEEYETSSIPVKMTVGISKTEREEGYSFAMLYLHDGQGTFLYDTDTDPWTMTFEVTDFRGTFVFVKYPSANTPADAPQTSSNQPEAGTPSVPAGNTGADELDDVPKMGDERTITLAVICAGSLLLGGAAFVYKRKLQQ